MTVSFRYVLIPVSQARLKASKEKWCGQDQALPLSSPVFLNAPRTTHRTGPKTMMAQTAMKPVPNTFRAAPDSPKRRRRSVPGRVPGGRLSGPGVAAGVCVISAAMSSCPPRSVLEALAARGAHDDERKDQGDEEDDDAHRAGVAGLAQHLEVAHQVGRQHLAVLV